MKYDQPDNRHISPAAVRQFLTDLYHGRYPRVSKVIFVIAALVFVTSAFFLIRYAISSIKTGSTNRELQTLHAVTDTPLPDATSTPVPTPSPTAVQTVSFVTPNLYADRDEMQTATPRPTLSPYYHDLSGKILSNMEILYLRNRDIQGWLQVDDLVDLPVVYRDNSYYLHRDFDGKSSDAGTLFIDEYGPVKSQTQQIIIHGHNMHDGSMFGHLLHYRNGVSFVRQHPFAVFSTLYKQDDYVIYAVARVSTDYNSRNFLQYVGQSSFASEYQFYAFIKSLRAASLYDIPVDVDASDALLTLSTCISSESDERLLLCFRRVRPGETKEQLKSIINRATAR